MAESERKAKVKSLEGLEVWQLGKELTMLTYELAQSLPEHEMYGFGSQIRRAALSIPANIAEGFGRYHYLDKVKFFLNARGALNELKSHFLIGTELRFFPKAQPQSSYDVMAILSVKLNNLIAATRRSQGK